MSKVSRWAHSVRHSTRQLAGDVATVVSGYREYRREGRTSDEAYSSLRRLFRSTNGRFNDVVGSLCSRLHPKEPIDLRESLFPHVDDDEVRTIGRTLRRDGVYRFDRQLPGELCQELLKLSLRLPGQAITLESDSTPHQTFDRKRPQSVRFQFQANDLFAHDPVQRVATDPYFQAIAQEYLGFSPVQDLMAMWWSAPGPAELQSRAAQLYHFDMDRFRFVKFFVYLTDVGPDNGPHCYVRGSHHRKPAALLRDQRISDEEMAQHYSSRDLLELTGRSGTLLAVDTRGFHKGKPLVTDDRLIFQIQFADSLFGQNYPSVEIPQTIDPVLLSRLHRYPRCYSNFRAARPSRVAA